MTDDRAKKATVRVRCVGCGNKRDIGPGEVPAGDVPFCEKCYMPMVAVSAVVTLD